jgi:hypothetical protein
MESFGVIRDHKCWLIDSLILTKQESRSLVDMTKSSEGILLYRATVDGFTSHAFHSKCDGKENTITIIKTDENYVFGGYASSAWNSSCNSIRDPNAFLFSLRRGGVSFKDKFTVKFEEYALFGIKKCGPTFGGGDINISDESNIKHADVLSSNRSLFGRTYELPDGLVSVNNEGYSEDFLAGNSGWITTEIEVYQINKTFK